MKVLVAPDKFKGCLTSLEAASIISQAVKEKGHQVIKSPLADGGEGTVDAILSAAPGQKKFVTVSDPLGRPIKSFFGLISAGLSPGQSSGDCPQSSLTAIIEMAAASGLHLLPESERNPLKTSTYGTGQLIKAALDYLYGDCPPTTRMGTVPIPKIIIGVGGSATNDGGMGVAIALGAALFDGDGNLLEGTGENLAKVKKYDLTGLDKRLQETQITVAADVDNPFYGEQGAAFVYGPQKGANSRQVKELDVGLRNLASVVKEQSGVDLQEIKGSGAAGGLAGGLVAFLGAEITGGTQLICRILGLKEKIAEADLIVTGEGMADEQTLYGKAPSGVINLAKKSGKPIAMICGQLGKGYENIEEAGVKLYPLAKTPEEVDECLKNPIPAIERAVKEILLVS